MRKIGFAALAFIGLMAITADALACHTQSCRRTLTGVLVCECGPHSP